MLQRTPLDGETYAGAHRRKRRWHQIVTGLACVVVFCTVYALILPAITLENQDCPLPEHTHTPDCYTQVTSAARQELICLLEETEGHAHTDACYDETGELVCQLEESEGHVHTDACYALVEEPVDTELLTCTIPEDENHTHTALCYGTWELTCGMEDHEHTQVCRTAETEAETDGSDESETFPDALPEGYCAYLFTDASGLTVEAYAPETAFGDRTVTLCAEVLDETSTAYAQAQSDLDTAGSTYDGFIAMDIHFADEDGAEVEPDPEAGRVYVRLDAQSLLPEEADRDSIAVQHHSVKAVQHIGTAPAVEETVVQTVADTGESTGSVEVTAPSRPADPEDPEHLNEPAALHMTAEFSVRNFSVFTVTWNNGTVTAMLRIHYVDELGIEIADALVDTTICNPDRTEHDRVHSSDYARNFVTGKGDGYYYVGAFTAPVGGYSVDYVTYVFSGADQGFRCSESGESGWKFLGIAGAEGVRGATEADLYLRYRYIATQDDTPRTVETASTEYGGESGQVVESGGTNTSVESDGVSVSKTLDATGIENVFDITLSVTTKTKVAEIEKVQPLDVVIVMDISNTMKSSFSGDTNGNKRCDVAVTAASNFINQFQQESADIASERRIGLVLFNTGLVEGFELSECKTEAQAKALIDKLTTVVNSYRDNDEYKVANTDIGRRRFTNMETGIVKAQQMLEAVDSPNKYMIFLTDGFPTTWGLPGTSYTTDTASTNGIEPYDSTGRIMRNRTASSTTEYNCTYGTSYSDTAAHWAEEHAKEARALGIKIFAIGVDVKGQSIATYEKQDADKNLAGGFSVIESIGDSHPTWRKTGKYVIDDTLGGGFTGWLENYIASGPGYYFDSDKEAEMYAAFNTIFQTIKTQTEHSVAASWVAEDPIMSGNPDYIEFISFYDKSGALASASLTGTAGEGTENTASWDGTEDTIDWNLKQSGYTTGAGDDGTTYYTYTLKYRVRLQNELDGFVENQPYATNGTTSLVYREVVDGSLHELKRIEFPIPQVKGYLNTFRFTKTDLSNGSGLTGAVFTLTHDQICAVCHGDGTPVSGIRPFTAKSDANGVVSFSNVPSGHDYVLKETAAPIGFALPDESYKVTVRYNDDSTEQARTKSVITVTKPDGITVTITDDASLTIGNTPYYELPSTGGPGTAWYMIGGLALVTGAGALLVYRHRKHGKGEHASS